MTLKRAYPFNWVGGGEHANKRGEKYAAKMLKCVLGTLALTGTQLVRAILHSLVHAHERLNARTYASCDIIPPCHVLENTPAVSFW